MQVIPVLTTAEGACLTAENWINAGATMVSLHLDALLIKPGLAFLQTINQLGDYVAWTGPLVLNAAALRFNTDGLISLISPFDGATLQLTSTALLDLVEGLKPAIFIAPHHMALYEPTRLNNLDAAIALMIPAQTTLAPSLTRPNGFYYEGNNGLSSPDGHAIYAIGASIPLATYMETNQPALDGCAGIVYSEQGPFSIRAPEMTNQFIPLAANCQCPTCQQSFTRAYLHHLFEHTPLLCQRFLIQHNFFYFLHSSFTND